MKLFLLGTLFGIVLGFWLHYILQLWWVQRYRRRHGQK